jgi:phytol kinase
MFTSNWIALLTTLLIALVWLRAVNFIAGRGWINSALSRKIIHIGTGPIFVLCWLLFNNQANARWLAALVPFLITIQFLLVGTGLLKDASSVKAMSRSGDRREILRGPLMYGIVFVVFTLIFWRTSPLGMVALMVLCAGDGLADVIGTRAAGSPALPWSGRKTWLGSLAMLLGGWAMSALILWIFNTTGFLALGGSRLFLGSGLVSFVSTVVESLPYSDIDNLTVPLAAICTGFLVF